MNWFKALWKKLTTALADATHTDIQTRPQASSGVIRLPPAEQLANFTPRAQQVMALARKEADRFHHNFVGTEHLLLGLIKLGQGVAVNVLKKMGLNLEIVRAEVEKQVGTGPDLKMNSNIPYTPRVKKVLAIASKEAKALNHTYVGTEHILLGLLREGDGVAAKVLKNLKVDIERTRQEILQELDPNFLPAADAAETSSPTRITLPPKPSSPPAAPSQPVGEAVDLKLRYDVYCSDWSQGVTVYRNIRFKGVKHLFPKSHYDALSGFLELEQADGQVIFVSRSSIIKFCEADVTPGPDSPSSQ